ncbi:uncharacterized protein LOC131652049 [Vicia villosa]|uniref:uncharacterized protein LOC131652049 n=1 Tax=Vicia villosa TaxID=3911 RepID=UPI00273A8DC1|nr:uncharacterized protein LOC131652049 [Vicia villosa]
MASSKVLQGQSVQVFNEGIGLILSRWSALRTAVENEWGGRDSHLKAQQFAADLLSWFTQSKEPLYIDDLETLIDEGMLSFNLEIQDGSVEEVAEELMIMHEECLDGDFSSVERLREASRNPTPHSQVQQVVNGDEDDDDSDEDIIGDDNSANMDMDIQKSETNLNSTSKTVNEPQSEVAGETADDGWVVVSKKKTKGRKN